MDDCRRMNPYSCPYACCWAAAGPLAAKLWLMPCTVLLNWLLYAVACAVSAGLMKLRPSGEHRCNEGNTHACADVAR